uniref:Collagen, type XI, alpha 2 n=1 Tax=Xenopus tropicalis TaxID=8364 RepID=F6RV16_XENTR
MGISLPSLFCLILVGITISCRAQDTCPDVKLIGVGESERMAILRGCPGSMGSPGQKGEAGTQGTKGKYTTKPATMYQLTVSTCYLLLGTTWFYPGIPGMLGPRGEKGNAHPDLNTMAAKNCMELLNYGVLFTGWYTIYLDGNKPIKVLCDMDTDGGGWIVFQRRVDGSVDFYRDWKSYKQGFGSQLSEFWLGNENIHRLTSSGNFQLRFDLEDFDNNRTYATYSQFRLEPESQNYTLRFREFTGGPAGDSLFTHKDRAFSTKDADNDPASKTNCAERYKGAWWYESCYHSCLNGEYMRGQHDKADGGVHWAKFRGVNYSLKVSEMKLRPEK